MIREEMEQGRKKANRNKTIDFSLEEGRKYLDSCLYISKEKPEPITCEMLKNQLIVGDTFEVMPKTPCVYFDITDKSRLSKNESIFVMDRILSKSTDGIPSKFIDSI